MKIAHISVGDWAAAVSHMTLEEEGFFWRMTRLMYAHDCVFADNDHSNSRLMNLNIRVYRRLKERMLSPEVGKPVLRVRDGKIVNARVVHEIEKFCEMKKTLSDRGREGARRRWEGAKLAEVSPKLPANFAETSPKLPQTEETKPNKNNDPAMGSANTPSPTPFSYTESPLPPKGDDDRVRPVSASRASPFKKRDPFALNADLNPEKAGIAYNSEGNLEVFNGTKVEMLKLVGGDEDQLRLDLLAIQSTNKVGPNQHPLMLKSKAIGALAEIVARRRDGDRRYERAVANNQRGRPGAPPPKRSELSIDKLPPTREEAEIARRFDVMLSESEVARNALQRFGRDQTFDIFRKRQLEKAGVHQ